MDYKFYALLSRMKYIGRWGIMRNTRTENIAEHSYQTALIAHALACIERTVFKRDADPERAAAYALFHETAEVITGDLPTPVKYFNRDIKNAYKDVERDAENRLLSSLPPELKAEITALVQPPPCAERDIVKYADKLSAFVKCIEERSCGNREFDEAYQTTLQALKAYNSEAVDYFLQNFIGAFYMNLDELSRNLGGA
jgi:5'-deoxynucleotidase